MKYFVNDGCIGCGLCEGTCPEVFHMTDAGVAAAIASGGPGAIFWMWIVAFFGMMTNFSENVLGIYYRRRNEKNSLTST